MKTILISSAMFNVSFFIAMFMNLFITDALAIGIASTTITYLFFEKLYYAQK